MNFSESFSASRSLVAYSSDGLLLASCSQHRLVVRDVSSLQIMHLHTCLEPVQQLLWSPDSLFILTAMFKRGIVQVELGVCVRLSHNSNSQFAGVVNRAAVVDL